MEPTETVELIKSLGFPFAVSVAIGFALWKQTIFILRENAKREERIAGVVETYLVATQRLLTEHDQRMTAAATYAQQLGIQQQSQHVKMLEVLAVLSGGRIVSSNE